MRTAGHLAVLALLVSVPAFAIDLEKPVPVESLTVQAGPWELRVDNIRPVSVITREAIERRSAASVPDLLKELAGVHVDRLGRGGSANVYIRGSEPNHVLVLIDGVRMNDPTDVRGGSYDFSSLSPDEIERVEVLSGASSAQFGGDAMGGIVNVVTRRSIAKGRAEAGLGIGGDGFGEGSLRVGSAEARWNAGATYRQDGTDEIGWSRLATGDGALAFGIGGSVDATLVARYARRESAGFPESSGAARLARDRGLENRDSVEKLVSLAGNATLPGLGRMNFKAAHSERDEDRESPAIGPGPGGFVPATTVSTRFRRSGANASIDVEGLPLRSRALLGVESWREDGRRDSVLRIGPGVPGSFQLKRDTRSAFTQLDAEASPDWRASLAARVDDVDGEDTHTTGGAGAAFHIADGNWLRFHWSDGFKPPSFFALGDPLVGNPQLRPERSRNAEIGVDKKQGQVTGRVAAFVTRYQDLVDFDPATFKMVNRAPVTTRGAEAGMSIATAVGARIEAAYTFLDFDPVETGVKLRNRPRHRGSISVSGSREGWSARMAAIYVGSTFDFSVPTGEVRLPAYATVDASLERRFGRWRASLAVDNAFNKRYEQFVGFDPGGIRVRIAVRMDL